MDWQQILSLSIVAATALAFVLARQRRRNSCIERDTHCGCKTSRSAEKSSIVYSAKKGERAKIVVKMR